MGSSLPDLPELANVHDDDGSQLARKFGAGLTNYFSGSPLNRVSFLRTDPEFLSAAFSSSETHFIALNDFAPLTHNPAALRYLTHNEIIPVTGPEPLKLSEADAAKAYDSTVVRPLIVFLGLWEDSESNFQYRDFKGRPWFAVDITPWEPYATEAQGLIDRVEKEGSSFLKATRQNTLNAADAAIYGQARGVTDWNLRNQYCASCGSPTLSVNAGYKRVCPVTDLAGTSTPQIRKDCPSRKGVSNISFPRSDPTMIAAVVSSDGKRVLLGRQKRWPPRFYSVLAGFLEPGESIEEAVRREVWEEAGVKVGRVVLHSSQPWPYPASLMIGAVASALPGGEDIHTGHDDELEDAKWVSIEEIKEALKWPIKALGDSKTNGEGAGKEEGLLLPPHTAIANRLLNAVVEGFAHVEAKI